MTTLISLRDIRIRFWVLAATGWVVLAIVMMMPPASPIRVVAVFLFVLAGPGYPMSALLVRDTSERWVLTIALSAALAILVTVVMTVLRYGSLPPRIAVLAAVTTIAALAWGKRAAGADPAGETTQGTAVKS
ncbi:hypothetical protein [Mycolicibacterium elephantis]|uniref:DUF1616 domain-containing protein n=1 Tax=Mycolicibacterium elephantis DSM 44368 TaxID=1335622 RepID=A0A439DQZ4_9MYCO|nr:hypothetical protein [Mycolicibacterium elephantis]MCV7219560.1 hypothetical protein [Mycolicibacterium elephantis]RWA18245.1 hypothetical protein MELE44368_23515 [Mycolicibacterium elephantis DSM 44368]